MTSKPTEITDFLPYVLPFGLFSVLTVLEPILSLSPAWLYPAKTVTTAVTLAVFWPRFKHQIRPTVDLNAVMAGTMVFLLWIFLDDLYPKIGPATRFNPHDLAGGITVHLLTACRLAGAVLVVPVMEELFWRSFALRFLIDTRFTRVAPGTFTWFSFIMVSIAFGIEHHRWAAGILAGAIYAMLWYQKKNLFSPILAHAVTNGLLGVYIIINGAWNYW